MRLWPSILIVTIIVIVGFLTLFLGTSRAPESGESAPEPRILAVTYVSDYEDTGYAMSGTARVPNRCLGVDASASYDAGTNAIIVALTNQPVEGICLEAATDVEFEIFVEAPEGATAQFIANGESIAPTPAP